MSEIIERVVKAIRKADVEIENNRGFSNDHYLILAKAAIEAMREPTEEMKRVVRAAPQIGSPDFDGGDYWDNFICDYGLMIDAALKE